MAGMTSDSTSTFCEVSLQKDKGACITANFPPRARGPGQVLCRLVCPARPDHIHSPTEGSKVRERDRRHEAVVHLSLLPERSWSSSGGSSLSVLHYYFTPGLNSKLHSWWFSVHDHQLVVNLMYYVDLSGKTWSFNWIDFACQQSQFSSWNKEQRSHKEVNEERSDFLWTRSHINQGHDQGCPLKCNLFVFKT